MLYYWKILVLLSLSISAQAFQSLVSTVEKVENTVSQIYNETVGNVSQVTNEVTGIVNTIVNVSQQLVAIQNLQLTQTRGFHFRKKSCARVQDVGLSLEMRHEEDRVRCILVCSDDQIVAVLVGGNSCACVTRVVDIPVFTECSDQNADYDIYVKSCPVNCDGALELQGWNFCLHSAHDQGPMLRSDASSYCRVLGGRLPKASSLVDLATIVDAFKGSSITTFGVWMNAKRPANMDIASVTSSSYTWQNGEQVNSLLWDTTPLQPNFLSIGLQEYLTATAHSSRKMHDVADTQLLDTVCMIPCDF